MSAKSCFLQIQHVAKAFHQMGSCPVARKFQGDCCCVLEQPDADQHLDHQMQPSYPQKMLVHRGQADDQPALQMRHQSQRQEGPLQRQGLQMERQVGLRQRPPSPHLHRWGQSWGMLAGQNGLTQTGAVELAHQSSAWMSAELRGHQRLPRHCCHVTCHPVVKSCQFKLGPACHVGTHDHAQAAVTIFT